MSEKAFKINGLDDFIEALEKAPKERDKIFKYAMYNSVKKVQIDAQQKAPRGVSSPGIKNSIRGQVESWYRGVVGVMKNVKHAASVEYGSRPHFPPPSALEKWARLKLRAKDAKSVAFLVARKISKYGTKAQPFLGVSLERNKSYITHQFDNALREFLIFLSK